MGKKTKLQEYSENKGHFGTHQLRIEEIIEEVNRCHTCILCPCHGGKETPCHHSKAPAYSILSSQTCADALREWAKMEVK